MRCSGWTRRSGCSEKVENPRSYRVMKLTLDHNCIIDMVSGNEVGKVLRRIVDSQENECYVVEIGASEMREKGVRPDRYDLFEQLLAQAGIAHLPRLSPMLILAVTFWDRCVWPDGPMIKLAESIESILFGDSPRIDISISGLESQAGRKWLNRLCDIHTMWCHIQSGNDAFLTSDRNFVKESKLPQLVAVGAKRICKPAELCA